MSTKTTEALLEINGAHPAVIARKQALIANGTEPLLAEKLAIDAAQCQAARDAMGKKNAASPSEASLATATANEAAAQVIAAGRRGPDQPPVSVDAAATTAVAKSAGTKPEGDVPPQLEPARAAAEAGLEKPAAAPVTPPIAGK